MTSLAHSMTRKGRLFWIQRNKQRSSVSEALGSPESPSGSGGSSSGSELEWSCPRLCPCEWGWAWECVWELTLDLLDDAPPFESPEAPVMDTLTSLLSALEAAAAVAVNGVPVRSSGCRFKDKPFPARTPRSLGLGCITAGDSLSFSALLESRLEGKQTCQTVCDVHGSAAENYVSQYLFIIFTYLLNCLAIFNKTDYQSDQQIPKSCFQEWFLLTLETNSDTIHFSSSTDNTANTFLTTASC